MIVVDQHTDPATITGRTIRADGATGRVVIFKHIDIDASTGRSRTGFEPGVVVELYTPDRWGCGSRFLRLPYGATIEIQED